MFFQFYRKIINIGIIILLIWFLLGKYDEYQKRPKVLQQPQYETEAQYSITIDPNKDPKDYTWVEKIINYFYKDEIQAYKQKYNLAKKHNIANFGDLVYIKYEYLKLQKKEQITQKLTYTIGSKTTIPQEAADKVLGMRVGQSKEIALKDGRTIKITLEKVETGINR
jgi:hypothetical protein